jgi:3-oxoacyl-[acyl-carrier-protein] synthase-3
MHSVVTNTRIAGIVTAVPRHKVNFFESPDLFSREEAERLFPNTGIAEIRMAPPHMFVSDMCCAGAEHLLEKLGWERSSIELIIFITQGPDVPLPATACLIQNRLGLPHECAAFDINLGCSGYVYGLWIAAQLLSSMNKGRALLMVGDKSTGGVRPGDRATVSLFGDGAAVTAIERTEEKNPMYVVAGTDGRGGVHLNVKAGGDRWPIPIQPKALSRDDFNWWMRASKVDLNGGEVFAFTLRVVPKLINEVLALAGKQKEDIDYYAFHQANKFILEHLGKKMKLPEGRAPLNLEKWGNTSSASVPLVICDKLGDILKKERKTLCMAGFGVGWSWSAAVMDVGPIPVADIYEIPDNYPCGSYPLTDDGYFKERLEKRVKDWIKYMDVDRHIRRPRRFSLIKLMKAPFSKRKKKRA